MWNYTSVYLNLCLYNKKKNIERNYVIFIIRFIELVFGL